VSRRGVPIVDTAREAPPDLDKQLGQITRPRMRIRLHL
jgi:hypothetical protein